MVKEEKLLLAVKQSNFPVIEKILQISKNGKIRHNSNGSKLKKLNLEIADQNGMNCLHHASLQGHANIVEALITAGSHVDSLDKLGQRPLHYASAKGHLQVLQTLLRSSSSVNDASCDGTTALHLASAFKHYSVAECLLKHGANVLARNQRGESPLDIAFGNNDYRMVTLLSSHPAIKQHDRQSSGYATPQIGRLSMLPPPMTSLDDTKIYDRPKLTSTTSDPTDSQFRRNLKSTSSNSSSSSCLSNSMNASSAGGPMISGQYNESKSSSGHDTQAVALSSSNDAHQIAQLRPTHSQHYCQPNLLRKSISLNAKKTDESSGVTSPTNSSNSDSLDNCPSVPQQQEYKRSTSLSPEPVIHVLPHQPTTRKKQSPMFASIDGRNMSLQSQGSEISSEFRQNLKEACFAVQARAIRDYRDESNPKAISFLEGDLITVLRSGSETMWKGFVTAHGVAHTGYFPGDAVSLCTLARKSTSHQRPANPTQSRHFEQNPGETGLPLGITPLQPLLSFTPGNIRNRNGTLNLSCNTELINHHSAGNKSNQSPNSPVAPCHPIPPQMDIPLSSAHLYSAPQQVHLSSVPSSSLSPNSQSSCGVPLSPCSSWSQSNYTASGSSNSTAQVDVCSNRNSISSMDSGRGSFSTGYALPQNVNGYQSAGHLLPSPPVYSSTRAAPASHDLMSQSFTLNSWQPIHEAQLCDWLYSIGMQKYSENLIQCGYDLPTLKRCNHEDLIACGVSHPNDRKIIKFELDRLYIDDNLPSRLPESLNQWLRALNLEQYTPTFVNNGHDDIKLVAELTWDDLDSMGIQKLGHLKKLCLAIKKLNQLLSSLPKQLNSSQQTHDCQPGSNNFMTRSCDQLHVLPPLQCHSPTIDISPVSPPTHENLPYHHSLSRRPNHIVSPGMANPSHRLSEAPYPIPPKRTTSIQALSSSSSSGSSHKRQSTNSPEFNVMNDAIRPPSTSSCSSAQRLTPSPIQSLSRSTSATSSTHSECRGGSGDIVVEKSETRSSSRGDNSGLPFANEEIGTIRCSRMSSSHHRDLEEERQNYQDENDTCENQTFESNPELDKDMENICEMLDVLSEELEKEISNHQREILA